MKTWMVGIIKTDWLFITGYHSLRQIKMASHFQYQQARRDDNISEVLHGMQVNIKL